MIIKTDFNQFLKHNHFLIIINRYQLSSFFFTLFLVILFFMQIIICLAQRQTVLHAEFDN